MVKQRTKQSFIGAVNRAKHAETLYGQVGEPTGHGTYRLKSSKPGFIRVRIIQNQKIVTILDALNSGVPLDPRIYVIVEKNAAGEYVARRDPTMLGANLDGQPDNAVAPHTHRIGHGLEDMVEPRRIEPGLVVVDDGTMLVKIYPFEYRHAAVDKRFAGGSIDLTPYRPATSGTWNWVKVGIDPETNTPVAVQGSEVARRSLLTQAELDAIAISPHIPLAGVQLKQGMANLDEEKYFADCRQWLNLGGGATATDPLTDAYWSAGVPLTFSDGSYVGVGE